MLGGGTGRGPGSCLREFVTDENATVIRTHVGMWRVRENFGDYILK